MPYSSSSSSVRTSGPGAISRARNSFSALASPTSRDSLRLASSARTSARSSQVVRVDHRVLGRVGRAEPEPAAAERADDAGHDRVAVAVLGLRVALDRHREVRHQRLQVGRGHARVALREEVRLQVVGLALGDRLRAEYRIVASAWSCRLAPTPARSARTSMPSGAQVVGRADAGQQQQLGRADHAAADDDVTGAAQLGRRPRRQGRVRMRSQPGPFGMSRSGRGGTGGRRPRGPRRRRPGF